MTAIWLVPTRDITVVVCTNLGGFGSQAAVDQAVDELLTIYLDSE